MDYLPYLVAGLVTGSVYGLAALGLVLTYKTSGVFNLAHGALATVSAYTFYELDVRHGLPWAVAAAACVLVLGPVMGLLLELLARGVTGASLAVKVASTVGLTLVVQSLVSLHYDASQTLVVPPYLPQGTFGIGSTRVTYAQVLVVVACALVAVALLVLFRTTRIGVAMRAVVDDAPLLDATGTDPARVRRTAWVIGASLAAASGVLLAPLLAQLNALNLTFLVVTAFGAAAVGWFTSLPIAYAGGLAIGIAQQLCGKWFTTGALTGLAPALPFLVLFVVLLVLPRSRLTEPTRVVPLRRGPGAPWQVQAVAGVVVLGLLAVVPRWDALHLTDWTTGLTYVLLFLSLGLLVRTSGQVSLAHVSFMAIGVSAMSHLTVGSGLPWGVALLLSGLVAVPIGAMLAVPAVRLGGLYLALATFGFGLMLQYLFYAGRFMFGDSGLGLTVPRPQLSGIAVDSDRGYYYLVLVLMVLAGAVTVGLTRSRLGRLLRALADSPVGLSTSGVSVSTTRVLVFCLSAFLAAVAGALQGAAVQQVSGDGYNPLLSLVFFTVIMVTVGREPWYALLAAFAVVLVPVYVQGASTTTWLQLLFGVTALLYPFADRLAGRLLRPAGGVQVRTAPSGDAQGSARLRVATADLGVVDLRVAYGGAVAVDGLTLRASTGRITGLIGPNGAGKSSTFNACSGLVRPAAGRITLDGRDLVRLGPAARARRGLGRTFQHLELFDSLTVRQNVELGAEGRRAGNNPLGHLLSSRATSRTVRRDADQALALCGLTEVAGRPAGALSTGQRRLVELARCLAGEAQVLLLDEPSSGLDEAETARFGEVLLEVVAVRGVGILLVEHDMSLVSRVCDDVHVLDFGRPVHSGPTAEVLAHPLVRSAYLGDAELQELLEPGPDDVNAAARTAVR